MAFVISDATQNGAGDAPEWALTLVDGSKLYGQLTHIGDTAYRLTDSDGGSSYLNAAHVIHAALHDSKGFFDAL